MSLLDLNSYPIRETLKVSLEDKAKNNIIRATDMHAYHPGCNDKNAIQLNRLHGYDKGKL